MNQTLSLSQWLTASRPVTTPVAWQGIYLDTGASAA